LLTLSQAFKLNPKQAAGFLAKENKYLNEACTKGLKTGFEQIIDWYQLVYSSSRNLSNLIAEESKESENALNLVMNTLKCGICSKSFEVIQWTIKLLSKMSFDFSNLDLHEIAYEWFTSNDPSVFTLVLNAASMHPNILLEISEVISSYTKGHFSEVFSEKLREYCKDSEYYWTIIVNFLPSLLKDESFKEELHPFFIVKIEEAMRDFENSENDQLNSVTITFLVELWQQWPDIIPEDISQEVLKMLKALTRSPERAVQYVAIIQMFMLLKSFTENKNKAAPMLYKSLIFCLIEFHADDTTRAFIMSNFIELFERSDTIPVGILVEPLIKQFMESESVSYKYNTFDFEFFQVLIKHPKLRLSDGISLMDALAKVYLNNPVFSFAAAPPFIMIISKFLDSPALMDYVK
jgi:flagellar biosynthesis/type III secretory pathway protein FliH